MSERPPDQLMLATVQVSADGKRVLPDENEVLPKPVSEAAALATLRAFAGLTTLELLDVDAKIYLEGPRGKVAVQNVGGKLFVAQMPESVNAAIERTPEQTIALLTAGDPEVTAARAEAAAVEEAAMIEHAARASGDWRKALSSAWTLALLVIAAGVIGYVTLAPDIPDDVQIVRDAAKIAGFNAELGGRYGNPAATVLTIADGKVIGTKPGVTSTSEEKLFEMGFRFGMHGPDVVLVTDNGALLEPQGDHSLRYLDSVYPRLAK